MRVTGMGIGFIDSEPGAIVDFNRWYDLDHLPENVALPGIIAARRYVATPDCKAQRVAAELEALSGGRGTFCTTYLFGAEDLGAVQGQMSMLARRLAKEGRMFRRARAVFYAAHRLMSTHVSKTVPAAPEAAPFLGHRGIYVSMGEVAEPGQRAEVAAWFEEVHIPDILEVPGILACLRLEPVDPEQGGRFTNLFLLAGDPVKTVEGIYARLPQWRQQGRIPSSGDSHRRLFRSAYRLITPLEYDFATGGNPR